MYVITGNQAKVLEIQTVLPSVIQMDIDLPEIQEINPQYIIEKKMEEAKKHTHESFIIEDTSLCIESLNGLPGPLIKWFIKAMGLKELYNLIDSYSPHNKNAVAKTLIGFCDGQNNTRFFEGTIEGIVVEPRGNEGFGWDSMFQPLGSHKTFAEMDLTEKNTYSMRKTALKKVKNYLDGIPYSFH